MKNHRKSKKTVKASIVAILFATLGLAASVRASDFSSTDTKHGATRVHSSSASYIDYAKFQWLPPADGQADAPVDRIVVSLADQRLYAYHAQELLAWSNVSSGRPGHETPTGSFEVSQKDLDHHSSLYEDASMPYFMRLTDDGVGMHAGFLPGYPASHGCVRLPFGMARELYQRVEAGTPVEITSNSVTMAEAKTPAAVHLAQD